MRKTKTNPDKIYNICSICVADAGMEDDALVKWLSEIILNDFERNNIPWNCDIIDSLIDAWKMSTDREMAADDEPDEKDIWEPVVDFDIANKLYVLYALINNISLDIPPEEECSDKENELYEEIANMRECLEQLGLF